MTADFEFLQGVLERHSTKLNTMLKGADLTDAKSVFNCVFRPISPYAVLALCVQKCSNISRKNFQVSIDGTNLFFSAIFNVLIEWTLINISTSQVQ